MSSITSHFPLLKKRTSPVASSGSERKKRLLLSAAPAQLAVCLAALGLEKAYVISSSERVTLERQLGLSSIALLRALLRHVLPRSVCPISHFKCSAAGLAMSGAIYLGTNLEFDGEALRLCETVHAEQFVIANAVQHGERALSALAVTAMPCGHCRQFMQELGGAAALRIVVHAPSSASDTYDGKLGALMPFAFGPGDLGKLTLGERQCTPLAVVAACVSDGARGDVAAAAPPLAAAALRVAEGSHAPYSGGRAGVALRSRGGIVATGGVIESCAFNPTLGPLQSALIAMRRRGVLWSDIVEGSLVDEGDRYGAAARVLFASLADPAAVFAVHGAAAAAPPSVGASSEPDAALATHDC